MGLVRIRAAVDRSRPSPAGGQAPAPLPETLTTAAFDGAMRDLPHAGPRLAARNVPMLTIKELAGHASIETTIRYMHLSLAAPREGIAVLEVRATRVAPATLAESKSSEIN